MKQTIRILLASFMLVCAGQAFAQPSIAVADLDAAIRNTELAKAKLSKLESNQEYKSLTAKYKALESDRNELIKEGNSKGMTWSDDRKIEQKNKIDYISSDMQVARAKIKNMTGLVSNETAKELSGKIKGVMDALIADKKLDVILSTRATHYAAEPYDITKEITERLNKAK